MARRGIVRLMTAHTEISAQEVRTFLALEAASDTWLTNTELAAAVEGVAPRSVRNYTLKFVKLGLLDHAALFPAHKYRMAARQSKSGIAYVQRLKDAAAVFGLASSGSA